MSDSLQRKRRQMQEQVGAGGVAEVHVSKRGATIYAVKCQMGCQGIGATTYRSGHDNRFSDAMERWTRHVAWHAREDTPAREDT